MDVHVLSPREPSSSTSPHVHEEPLLETASHRFDMGRAKHDNRTAHFKKWYLNSESPYRVHASRLARNGSTLK